MIGKGTNSRGVIKTAGFRGGILLFFVIGSISILWIPGALSICLEKPVRIFCQMEQHKFFHKKKWNGTSVFHLTGVTLKHERRHVFGQKSAYSSREHGTSGWQQMEHQFSDHFGKNEKRGIPLKVFLFFRKISSGKARSI